MIESSDCEPSDSSSDGYDGGDGNPISDSDEENNEDQFEMEVTVKRQKPPKVKRFPDELFKWKTKGILAGFAADRDLKFTGKFSRPEAQTTDDLPEPVDYFRMFITKDMIQMLVDQSNQYNTWLRDENAKKPQGQKKRNISPLNMDYEEMEKFIGIMLYIGATGLPSYRAYWEHITRLDMVAGAMSRNRFEQIKMCFHIVDNNTTVAGGDRYYKVRPLLNELRVNCNKVENEEAQSIDEIMIPFKGHSSLKQYMPKKPMKWGFKFFARCGQDGFVYDFIPYACVTPEPPLRFQPDHYGLGGNIVLCLAEVLFGTPDEPKNHKLYFDNFFTSLELIRALSDNYVHAVGTINVNRLRNCVLDSDKTLQKRGRGSVSYQHDVNNDIAVVRWFDNKGVQCVSNYAAVQPFSKVERWDATKKKNVVVDRPFIISEYNKNMGGVDLSDMLASLYRIDHRSRKWYMRIVFWVFCVGAQNAWNLHKRHIRQISQETGHEYRSVKKLKFYAYTLEIVRGLVQAHTEPPVKLVVGPKTRGRGRPRLATCAPVSPATTASQSSTASDPDEDSDEEPAPLQKKKAKHVIPLPSNVTRYDGYKHYAVRSRMRNRCRYCNKSHNGNIRSFFYCKKCNVYLCIDSDRNCFLNFHEKV